MWDLDAVVYGTDTSRCCVKKVVFVIVLSSTKRWWVKLHYKLCSAVYLSEPSHHRLQPDSLVLYLQPFLAKGVLPSIYLRWSGWNLHIIDNLWNALKDLCLALQSYTLILWPLCCIILPSLTNIHCLIECTMTTLSPPVSVAINQSIIQSFITLCLMQHFGQCITEM